VKHLNNQFIGDQESVRQINLSAVLTRSRQSAPISRAALAEITGLNWATITRLVREAGFQFLHADCLFILLQLNPDAGCIVVAEIKVEFGSLVLTGLSRYPLA
jgi:hypothetical protein